MTPTQQTPLVLDQQPQALDRDLLPINVGDRVRFVARGFFHPRGQESFGTVENIDECGGIKIKMTTGYKHFLTSKKIGDIDDYVYFTHHRYDAEKHARVYFLTEGEHELFIAAFSMSETDQDNPFRELDETLKGPVNADAPDSPDKNSI